MWKTIVGGVVGAMIGGPVGAAAGAFAGAAMEGDSSTPKQHDYGLTLRYIDDADGRTHTLQGSGLPPGTLACMLALKGEQTYCPARLALYADSDGDFFGNTAFVDGRATLWAPFGVVAPVAGKLTTRVNLLVPNGDKYTTIGTSTFSMPWPNHPPLKTAVFKPLISLCMVVARSDEHLDRSEVQAINRLLKQQLDIDASENDQIRSIMKAPAESVETLCDQIFLRMPWVSTAAVIEALGDVARADGRIDPREVAVIKQVAAYCGVDDGQWAAFESELGLDQPAKMAEYCTLLGLSGCPTETEIKRAYRSKAAQYHPDKYQSLPEEFQAVAGSMMVKLSEARDALLRMTQATA